MLFRSTVQYMTSVLKIGNWTPLEVDDNKQDQNEASLRSPSSWLSSRRSKIDLDDHCASAHLYTNSHDLSQPVSHARVLRYDRRPVIRLGAAPTTQLPDRQAMWDTIDSLQRISHIYGIAITNSAPEA